MTPQTTPAAAPAVSKGAKIKNVRASNPTMIVVTQKFIPSLMLSHYTKGRAREEPAPDLLVCLVTVA